MGDDDELGLIGHLTHIAGKANHVGVVQSGLDLVHNAEGRGTHLQNGEIQGNGHEGTLAAGQQRNGGQLLSGGLSLDLNAAVEDIVGVFQLQCGLAAAKQLQEGLGEGGLDGLELLGEDDAHLLGDLGDDALQLGLGPLHVVTLLGQVGIALVDTLILLDGVQIDVAQTGDGSLEFADTALCFPLVLQLHTLLAGRLVGQLIGLPQFVQNLLFFHGGRQLFLLQHGDLALHVQQFGVLVAAVLIRLVALGLQGQLFLVQAADAVILFLNPGAQSLQSSLLLHDLGFQRFVALLELLHHAGLTCPVAIHIPAQTLQLGHGLLGCHPLALQGGHAGAGGGQIGVDGGHLLLKIALSLCLALRFGTQGGGGALQLGDAVFRLGGIALGLGGAGTDLLQFGLQSIPALFQLPHLIPGGGHTLLQLQDGVLMLAALSHGGFHFIVGGSQFAACFLQGAVGALALLYQLLQLLPQTLQFVGTGQNTRAAAGGAAGHGAAGV